MAKVYGGAPCSPESTAEIQVGGMTCAACSGTVERMLNALEGVSSASVNLMLEKATVKFDSSITAAQLVDAIEDVGFDAEILSHRASSNVCAEPSAEHLPVTVATAEIQVGGMTCAACSSTVERMLKALGGVSTASVNLMLEKATVTFENIITAQQLIDEIEDIGFDAELLSERASGGGLCRTSKSTGAVNTAEIQIGGMTCAACSSTVERMLNALDGVSSASVNLMSEKATVTFDSSLTVARIVEEIEDIGFDAELLSDRAVDKCCDASTPLNKDFEDVDIGRACVFVKTAEHEKLKDSPGVLGLYPQKEKKVFRVEYNPKSVGARHLLKMLGSEGTRVEAPPSQQELKNQEAMQKMRLNFLKSAGPALVVFFLALVVPGVWPSLAHSLRTTEVFRGISLQIAIVLILTLPVQFVWGAVFHKNAWNALKRRSANMDVLVSGATNLAFWYCLILFVYTALDPFADRKDAAKAAHFLAMCPILVAVMLGGKHIESRAKARTVSALRTLSEAAPRSACLIENGIEKDIPTDLIMIGDRLRIRPGSHVPADGVVITSGNLEVDEALLTGESTPVPKKCGSSMLGGSICCSGQGEMKVTMVGEHTALGRIVASVTDAQATKAGVQRIADRIAAYFVPTVLMIAVLTFIFWFVACSTGAVDAMVGETTAAKLLFSLTFALATMMVACPCAMGLATPTAVSVATGVAASRFGCLVKKAEALELGSRVDAVVFDKTGTLTTGNLTVVATALFPTTLWQWLSQDEKDSPQTDDNLGEESKFDLMGTVPQDWNATAAERKFWWLVGSCEQGSEHPIAKCLVSKGRARCTALSSLVEDFEALEGKGVRARVTDHVGCGFQVEIGKSTFAPGSPCHELFGSSREFADLERWATEYQDKRNVVLIATVKGVPIGAIALGDGLQENALSVVQRLEDDGVEVHLCTGDSLRAGWATAQAVGISHVTAEALPATKVELVKRLQDKGKRVCMVGDGINDAPALAQADLGVAIGAGASITADAADVVLIRSQLTDFFAFMALSRATIVTIYRNFLWAFLFNFVMLPVAAGVFYPMVSIPPLVAGLAMAMSSTLVVSSSLLLKRFSVPSLTEQRPLRHKKGFQQLADEEELPSLLGKSMYQSRVRASSELV